MKRKKTRFPAEGWEWYGHAAHFCCGQWCRFHMATKVGPWLVSTVGLYVHPSRSGSSEEVEHQWLRKHPNGEEIGCGRFYETLVFRAGEPCTASGCDCGLPAISGSELDMSGYLVAGAARRGHLAMCNKWAEIETVEEETK